MNSITIQNYKYSGILHTLKPVVKMQNLTNQSAKTTLTHLFSKPTELEMEQSGSKATLSSQRASIVWRTVTTGMIDLVWLGCS